MLRDILIIKDNYSEFVRTACWEKLQMEGDQTLLKAEKQKLQGRIKEIDGKLKGKPVDQDKIQELLAFHAPNYKESAPYRIESKRLKFIEMTILPKLKRAGYKGTPTEIDELLLNWPEGD